MQCSNARERIDPLIPGVLTNAATATAPPLSSPRGTGLQTRVPHARDTVSP